MTTEEVFETGDVFCAPAGHTAIVDEDLRFIDFSPTKETDEVLAPEATQRRKRRQNS